MSEWSHLLNAKHIDWIIQSLKYNPKVRSAAGEATWDTEWDSAKDAAMNDAFDIERDSMVDPIMEITTDIVNESQKLGELDEDSCDRAWDAAWNAILALVAYDDCEKYLDVSYEELLSQTNLDPHPACVLLLPYAYVKECIMGIKEHFGVEE